MICPTPEINNFFKFNDPKYQLGYKDGFEDAKAEMLIDLKRLTRKLETLSAFRTSTSTGSIIIKLGVK